MANCHLPRNRNYSSEGVLHYHNANIRNTENKYKGPHKCVLKLLYVVICDKCFTEMCMRVMIWRSDDTLSTPCDRHQTATLVIEASPVKW